MPKSEAQKFGSIILCDDIRQERNGKYILIGVYSGDVLFPTFPAVFAPQLYIEFMAGPQFAGEHETQITFYVDGVQKAELNGALNVVREGTSVWPLPSVVIETSDPAELRVDVSIDAKAPKTILRKMIRLNPDASSTASAPPSG